MPTISTSRPSLKAVRQRAWDIFIDLVEHVDLTGLIGDEEEPPPLVHRKMLPEGRELTLYACACLHSLHITTIISNSSGGYMCVHPLFEMVEYSDAKDWFDVFFNPLTYGALRQLQEGIRLLRSVRALTPRNLTSLMHELNPTRTFELQVKSLPSTIYRPIMPLNN